MEIKTKFNVGDKVWVMYDNKATEAEIFEVYFKQSHKFDAKDRMGTEITYMLKSNNLLNFGVFPEGIFYASKEELINSL